MSGGPDPVILAVLEKASFFLFGESRMVFYLFNEGKSSVCIEAVPQKDKVFIEGPPCVAVNIMLMHVYPEVNGGSLLPTYWVWGHLVQCPR